MFVMRSEKMRLSRHFCYKCGTAAEVDEPLINGLCQKCFFSEYSLLKIPSRVEVRVCRKCGAYLIGNKWREPEETESAIEEAVISTVLSQLRILQFDKDEPKFFTPSEVEGVKISPRMLFKSGKEAQVEVRAFGKVHPLQKISRSERALVDIKLNFASCNVCSLKSAGHYEAILQVRGVEDSEKMKIKKMLENYVEGVRKSERAFFIAREEEKRNGFDLYVNPLSLARRMTSLIKSEFKVNVSESAKFVGVTRDGQKKYIVSIVVRLKRD